MIRDTWILGIFTGNIDGFLKSKSDRELILSDSVKIKLFGEIQNASSPKKDTKILQDSRSAELI